MEKINERFTQLNRIKGDITDEYLRTAALADLKGKVEKITNIAREIHQDWDTTRWEDLPDAETQGYESKRQDASDLRDEIIGLIKPRMTELEAVEAKSELTGAQGVAAGPVTTVQAQLDELKAIHEQLKADRNKVTRNYLRDETREILEAQLNTVKVLKDSFMQKFNLVDQTHLSIDQGKLIKDQRKDVTKWGDDMIREISEQITTLTIRESTVWIKAQLEEKQKCDDEIAKQKREKEIAEKERDTHKTEREKAEQRAADLQRQLDQLEQQPSTLHQAEEQRDREAEEKREALRQRDELQKELENLRRQTPATAPVNPIPCPQKTDLDRIERELSETRTKADRAERQRREAERKRHSSRETSNKFAKTSRK